MDRRQYNQVALFWAGVVPEICETRTGFNTDLFLDKLLEMRGYVVEYFSIFNNPDQPVPDSLYEPIFSCARDLTAIVNGADSVDHISTDLQELLRLKVRRFDRAEPEMIVQNMSEIVNLLTLYIEQDDYNNFINLWCPLPWRSTSVFTKNGHKKICDLLILLLRHFYKFTQKKYRYGRATLFNITMEDTITKISLALESSSIKHGGNIYRTTDMKEKCRLVLHDIKLAKAHYKKTNQMEDLQYFWCGIMKFAMLFVSPEPAVGEVWNHDLEEPITTELGSLKPDFEYRADYLDPPFFTCPEYHPSLGCASDIKSYQAIILACCTCMGANNTNTIQQIDHTFNYVEALVTLNTDSIQRSLMMLHIQQIKEHYRHNPVTSTTMWNLIDLFRNYHRNDPLGNFLRLNVHPEVPPGSCQFAHKYLFDTLQGMLCLSKELYDLPEVTSHTCDEITEHAADEQCQAWAYFQNDTISVRVRKILEKADEVYTILNRGKVHVKMAAHNYTPRTLLGNGRPVLSCLTDDVKDACRRFLSTHHFADLINIFERVKYLVRDIILNKGRRVKHPGSERDDCVEHCPMCR